MQNLVLMHIIYLPLHYSCKQMVHNIALHHTLWFINYLLDQSGTMWPQEKKKNHSICDFLTCMCVEMCRKSQFQSSLLVISCPGVRR